MATENLRPKPEGGRDRSREVAKYWVRGAFRSRRKTLLSAVAFNALGPFVALLAVGVLLSLMPSPLHEFGTSGVRIGNFDPDMIEPYMSASDGRASPYCDSSTRIDDIPTRIRSINGAAAASSVGLGSAPVAGEVALSPRLAALLNTGAGETVSVTGTPMVVAQARALNPNATDALIAAVSFDAEVAEHQNCTMLVTDNYAAESIHTDLSQTLGEAVVFDLAIHGQTVEQYSGTSELRRIWFFATALAIAASAAVSTSYWALVLPGLFRDSLSLVALGVLPKHVKQQVAQRVLVLGVVALTAGTALGAAVAAAMSERISSASNLLPMTTLFSPGLLVATLGLGLVGVVVQMVLMSRPLASHALFSSGHMSLLTRPTKKRLGLALASLVSALVLIFARSIGWGDKSTWKWLCVAALSSVGLRHLMIWSADFSRDYAAKNFARSVRALAPAAALSWLVIGVFGFIAVFATLESGRAYPDVSSGLLVAADEWDWSTSSESLIPTAAPRTVDVASGSMYTVALQVGDGTQSGAIFGAAHNTGIAPAYVATPELVKVLEIDVPEGADVFTSSSDPQVLLGDIRLANLEITHFEGDRSRSGPTLFFTPEIVERFNLSTVEAALIVRGSPEELAVIADELALTGTVVKSGRTYEVSWVVGVVAISLCALSVVMVAVIHRHGLALALSKQARALFGLGLTSRRIHAGYIRTSILSALAIIPILVTIMALPMFLLSHIANFNPTVSIIFVAVLATALLVAVALSAPRQEFGTN